MKQIKLYLALITKPKNIYWFDFFIYYDEKNELYFKFELNDIYKTVNETEKYLKIYDKFIDKVFKDFKSYCNLYVEEIPNLEYLLEYLLKNEDIFKVDDKYIMIYNDLEKNKSRLDTFLDLYQFGIFA